MVGIEGISEAAGKDIEDDPTLVAAECRGTLKVMKSCRTSDGTRDEMEGLMLIAEA